MMEQLNYQLTLMGVVTRVDADTGSFQIRCRSGAEVVATVDRETLVRHLENLDGVDRDRVSTPPGFRERDPQQLVRKYVRLGRLVALEGIRQVCQAEQRYCVRIVHLLHNADGDFLFEESHWWLTQIRELADVWLSYLFGESTQYDFTRYSTDIDISGIPTRKGQQECATLSRLVYGLSSAYLLTGSCRFLDAARAGVSYQREHFTSPTEDGQGILWAFARTGRERIMASQNPDDAGSIPLYEQIYALAGLAQYYRITLDPTVLHDIRRTIHAFNCLFLDPPLREESYDHERADARVLELLRLGGGYFSHLDYPTISCRHPSLGHNQGRKNWNSIGDHIPAYLANLVLALDPLPKGLEGPESRLFLETCRTMLNVTADLILEHFPDPGGENPFVRERFLEDWTYDPEWSWQRDRAIVGHNLKIAWNLTRVAIYLRNVGDQDRARRFFDYAERTALAIAREGLDMMRGGVYDVIERSSVKEPLPRFSWWTTKDFWQQEQGILAYLILYGYAKLEGRDTAPELLDLARETMAFWNLFFLDHDQGGIYFRVTEDGLPFLLGGYQDKGGHSISGYHAFELNYLAHVYLGAFVRTKRGFSLKFRPNPETPQRSINVLPDFLPREILYIRGVTVNGSQKNPNDINAETFHVLFDDSEVGCDFVVEFGVRENVQEA